MSTLLYWIFIRSGGGHSYPKNIARGTTDPGYFHLNYLLNIIEFVSILDSVAWVRCATTWIGYKFGHQMVPLAFITNLATRWRYLHQLQFRPLGGATCIGWKLAPLAFIQNLVIRWCHLHWLQIWPPGCVTWIALLALSVSIESVSSSAGVTSVDSAKHQLETLGPIDRTPGIPGSNKNCCRL